jgi:carboxylesterase type B
VRFFLSSFAPLRPLTSLHSWGESAGAMSVGIQMAMNGGDSEGLFRGASMQSGSPLPTGPLEGGQVYFDTFATVAGCGDSLGSAAVFDCLRGVSTDVICYLQGITICCP